MNILNPTFSNERKPLIEFNMITKPLEYPQVDSIVDVKIRSIRFDYNPNLVTRMNKFFDIHVTDEELKK